ncbi:hypothetical protein [Mucilaginibacter flavus]|uniref:hypothetical protein n=1 Tax=Mucilaginibacter flavus TaxID=931504 RepID=UPI0025B37492|nr:hypothetical protein [Mucilaginibacter flavus]MDN3581064.1 hypothetical protein [Mucilaginibacter flavus]
MSKKRTMPVEPDEMPVNPKNPEIGQPTDPGQPVTPEEAPENIPQELPPDELIEPEVNPDKFEK